MRIISVARKPLAGSVAQTVLRYGTGGLNIDGCRIGPAFTSAGGNNFSVWRDAEGRTDLPPSHAIPSAQQVSGRWPTNIILQHQPGCQVNGTVQIKGSSNHHQSQESIGSSGCVYLGGKPRIGHDFVDEHGLETTPNWACQTGCPVPDIDAQSGDCLGMSGGGPSIDGGGSDLIPSYNRRATRPEFLRKDSGGSSRFFKQVKA